MNTYFLTLDVVPTKESAENDIVESAVAFCWAVADNPEDAFSIASFHVSKFDWIIKKTKKYPLEVTREDYVKKNLGLQCFDKAQKKGFEIVFFAEPRDGKTTGYKELKPSYKININTILDTFKKCQAQGRCLHYDSDKRCKEIIRAHSIQKQGFLSKIATDGHVYRIISDYGAFKKNNGKFICKKVGINKVSTFLGFCQTHDNELFEKIDDHPLSPTSEQVFLYGYRSLCREIFVKENILNLLDSQEIRQIDQEFMKKYFNDHRAGTAFGLKNLQRHKSIYDNCLKKKDYQNIKYVLFISDQKPSVAFSGLLYPDFDFMGRCLQDLGDFSTELELITFCSAPMTNGWGFLFSWHESSSRICQEYVRSLAMMVNNGVNIENMLFRLVISNCENHAFSPIWWDSLPKNHQEQIIERAFKIADNLVATPRFYLMTDLEGIVDWKFESVIFNT